MSCHLIYTAYSAAALFKRQGSESPKIHFHSLLKEYARLRNIPKLEDEEKVQQVQS